jgi:hypothetical protein
VLALAGTTGDNNGRLKDLIDCGVKQMVKQFRQL